ncbi:DUF4232 domain-containing protein [Streptomyces nymphaeiformis]|uniref:DUF4232 domain-containing protein n=1 Tax=Streptomyces nymphaeiformis TaxID=2663842 RepID=A0A7W7TWT7_9ACTN|nr:DUF4232 domain-containing protein [Streptomyces nymphaeiformis]MBB4980516.1 hypothetical protein [Streptomyces nymphaeiformis]
MRRTRLALPAALTGLLLLTACGAESRGAAGGGGATATTGCGKGDRVSAAPGDDGVTVLATGTGPRPCAAYSLTSRETEPFTYTVTLQFLSEAGQALTSVEDTAPAVAPGATVRRTVTADDLPPGASGTARVKVVKVRSVPTSEAPSEGGVCPPSGVRVYADQGDAAMGLRVVGLHLENCGTGTYRLQGHPRVELRDEDHEPVEGVTVLKGGEAVATGTGADGPALPLALEPGERAYAGLVWRNTVEAGMPVNAPYARVWAKPGAAPVTVTPELDLGTTGRLGVGPWKKEDDR